MAVPIIFLGFALFFTFVALKAQRTGTITNIIKFERDSDPMGFRANLVLDWMMAGFTALAAVIALISN